MKRVPGSFRLVFMKGSFHSSVQCGCMEHLEHLGFDLWSLFLSVLGTFVASPENDGATTMLWCEHGVFLVKYSVWFTQHRS